MWDWLTADLVFNVFVIALSLWAGWQGVRLLITRGGPVGGLYDSHEQDERPLGDVVEFPPRSPLVRTEGSQASPALRGSADVARLYELRAADNGVGRAGVDPWGLNEYVGVDQVSARERMKNHRNGH